jgi:hypothetical protein
MYKSCFQVKFGVCMSGCKGQLHVTYSTPEIVMRFCSRREVGTGHTKD